MVLVKEVNYRDGFEIKHLGKDQIIVLDLKQSISVENKLSCRRRYMRLIFCDFKFFCSRRI